MEEFIIWIKKYMDRRIFIPEKEIMDPLEKEDPIFCV